MVVLLALIEVTWRQTDEELSSHAGVLGEGQLFQIKHVDKDLVNKSGHLEWPVSSQWVVAILYAI